MSAPTADQIATDEPTSALGVRNFRLFFIGGTVSNTGRWMSSITFPYIMNELTGRGLWVGLGGLAALLPMALLSPWAGSLADRYPRRKILLMTQSSSALIVAGLALMWWSGVREPTAYLALAVASGVSAGLGVPAWQALVSELVPRRMLLQAVTLNSAQFSASRAIGPVVAGFVLQSAGPTWTFAIDAISFGAALTAVALIRVPRLPTADRGDTGSIGEFRETLSYVRREQGLSTAVIGGFIVGLFGMSIMPLLVLFADDVYGKDARWLGWMTGLLGLGAVLATPVVGRAKAQFKRSSLMLASLVVYCISIGTFAMAPWLALSLAALVFMGGAHIVSASTLNTALQLQVEETKRGKTLALYLMGVLLGVPLGNFALGAGADVVGPRLSVAFGALAMAVATVWFMRSGRLSALDSGEEF